MIILTNWYDQPWAILLLLICIFGLIALGVFLLRKFVINKNQKREEIDEEKVADENLSRFLEDVEDPEAQKQFEEFSKKENNEKEDK